MLPGRFGRLFPVQEVHNLGNPKRIAMIRVGQNASPQKTDKWQKVPKVEKSWCSWFFVYRMVNCENRQNKMLSRLPNLNSVLLQNPWTDWVVYGLHIQNVAKSLHPSQSETSSNPKGGIKPQNPQQSGPVSPVERHRYQNNSVIRQMKSE